MSRPGAWQPGQSGNPNGRPLKNRALTEILERAGSRSVQDQGGDKKTARRRILARLLWELATEGSTIMPDNTTELRLDPSDWVGLVKWIYSHIDGPPKAEVDITSGGQPIKVVGVGIDVDKL